MLWIAASCWAPIADLGERDVVLSPLPLFHSYALDLLSGSFHLSFRFLPPSFQSAAL